MNVRNLLLLALGVCVAWAASASADSVYLRYDSDGPTRTGNFWPNTTGYNNFYIGRSNFTEYYVDPITNRLPVVNGVTQYTPIGTTTAYCIDVNHLIWTGHTDYFELRALENVPIASVQAHASDLRKLFYLESQNPVGSNPDRAAAMAASVWEIATETGSTYDLTSGYFGVIPTGDGKVGGVYTWLATAQSWLSQLNADRTLNHLAQNHVTAYYNANTQSFAFSDGGLDQPPVPEPITMATVFLAVSGIGMYLRKRAHVAE